MKVHLISDVHLEFSHLDYTPPECDLVVAAGDIHKKLQGVDWLRETFPGIPVVYVAGNHEYYGAAIPKLTKQLESAVDGDIHFLERSTFDLGGIRILGATLWTDFELLGDRRVGMAAAGEVMQDYRRIRSSPRYSRLRPVDTLKFHLGTLRWLRDELASHPNCVVVTHHAPSLRSVAEPYRTDPVSSAYASDLEAFIEETRPLAWWHGHTHYAVDYTIGDTTVVSNPRGYADEPVVGFDDQLVLEVVPRRRGSR